MAKPTPPASPVSFLAAFAPNRKSFQMDTEGEATVGLPAHEAVSLEGRGQPMGCGPGQSRDLDKLG